MNKQDYPILQYSAVDNIGLMTLSNGADNKIENAVFLDLIEFKQWLQNNNFKGLVITGKGRHFSSGANVDYIKKSKECTEVLEKELNRGKEILNYIAGLPIVTIAAITGVCFGAGLEVALSCDYRFAASNSLLSFPESSLGLMPGLGGTVRLPALIGHRKAQHLILSGQIMTSEEAYDMGIIDKILGKKRVLDEAIQFIRELTTNLSEKQIEFILKAIRTETQDNQLLYEQESNFFVELVKEMKA